MLHAGKTIKTVYDQSKCYMLVVEASYRQALPVSVIWYQTDQLQEYYAVNAALCTLMQHYHCCQHGLCACVQNHQIDQLKEEISGKDLALVKEHFDHMKVCSTVALQIVLEANTVCCQLMQISPKTVLTGRSASTEHVMSAYPMLTAVHGMGTDLQGKGLSNSSPKTSYQCQMTIAYTLPRA